MIRLLRYLAGPLVALGLLAALPAPVAAQQTAKVVTTCGSASYTAGSTNYVTVDTTGAGCGSDAALAAALTTPPADVVATGSITIVDTGSTTTTGQNGVTIYAGTATTGSYVGAAANGVSAAITAIPTIGVNIAGTWTGTLQAECAKDNPAATFSVLTPIVQTGSAAPPTQITANGSFNYNTAACTGFRIHATATMTGSAAITIVKSNSLITTPSVNGVSVKSYIVANNTTSVAIDANPGQIYAIAAYAISSGTPAYLKIYNAAQGSTTCGSGTPVERHLIPTGSAGAGVALPLSLGVSYSTAITACVTGGIADNDTTAPAASTYLVNVYYH